MDVVMRLATLVGLCELNYWRMERWGEEGGETLQLSSPSRKIHILEEVAFRWFV
jgi:hypothetical protein